MLIIPHLLITEPSGNTRRSKVQTYNKAVLCKEAAEARGAKVVISINETAVREFNTHMVEYAKTVADRQRN